MALYLYGPIALYLNGPMALLPYFSMALWPAGPCPLLSQLKLEKAVGRSSSSLRPEVPGRRLLTSAPSIARETSGAGGEQRRRAGRKELRAAGGLEIGSRAAGGLDSGS